MCHAIDRDRLAVVENVDVRSNALIILVNSNAILYLMMSSIKQIRFEIKLLYCYF